MLVPLLACTAACICVVVYLKQTEKSSSSAQTLSPEFKNFQFNYFLVFLLANGADWLQGPYVYALYESYGHNKLAISTLFVAGFLSSMIFGTFAGSLADIYGRRVMAIAFSVIYGFSCLTKLSPDFYVLLLGRFTGGIATSLLFSVFESWMVHEHHRQGHDQASLDLMFSQSVTYNGITAIVAGLAAYVVERLFGLVAPFMLSFVLLVVLLVIVYSSWTENYGNADLEVTQSIMKAVGAIRSNRSIWLLGVVQSLFEGSMYVFVFLWTPTLSKDEGGIAYFGLVFSVFMVAIMAGSSLFARLAADGLSPLQLLQYILLAAACCLSAPVLFSDRSVNLTAFVCFEFCCGLYFPTVASLRSVIIPEASRTTIMSLFRIGLNILVIVALQFSGILPIGLSFLLCVFWLLGAFLVLKYLFPEQYSLKEEPATTLVV